ncbi:carboxylic ester hydrolase isoform X2 [Linepithema humile]|uniref:carboxylic ester hydrolase isoform X2 n=1 Tax=Linepithema humile TaxID=83485 RepID=UPI00351F3EC9
MIVLEITLSLSEIFEMWKYRNSLFIQLCCICLFAFNANGAPVVTISNGTLVGTIMYTRLGREINTYRSIPYAAPPVGELRFKPPQPASAWNGILQAVQDAQECTQRNVFLYMEDIIGDEDCLYLNVYTPSFTESPEKSTFARYPVMFYVHGGGFLGGGSHSAFHGPRFLLDQDIILVTVNYRLGPLGFLSTEDLECPGNLGLKDQQQALRWVQENIAHFGGDPNRVTIFGNSAGGASVHYHMVSPLSEGLFHRGISQSGTFYCPWTLTPPGTAKKNAKILGSHLNCKTQDSKEFIECLRTKTAKEIIGTDHIFQQFGYCPLIPFRPVIEPKHPGAFITEDPVISVREGRLADVPWMTGITSEEGSLKVPGIYGGNLVKRLNDDFINIAPISLLFQEKYRLHDKKVTDEISSTIRKYYFGHDDIDESDKARFNAINMYSDAWFSHCAHTAVRDFIVNQTSPLYYYYFAYRGSASLSSIFGDSNKNYGVAHADELQYLFPQDFLFKDLKLTEDDNKMVDILTTMWYNFAKSGNPTPKITKLIPLKWKPVKTNDSPEYLHIKSKGIFVENNLLSDRMTFWDTLADRMIAIGEISKTSKDEL